MDAVEILRVVVRESMSLDLLDQLISDIIEVTEKLMKDSEEKSDTPPKKNEGKKEDGNKRGGLEKELMSLGLNSTGDGKGTMGRGMSEGGIHRSVC